MKKQDVDLMPVVDFITASRENLEIANAVHELYAPARAKIMDRFFDQLGERLMGKLPGWSWKYSPAFFTQSCGRFAIWKNQWKYRYVLAIEAYGKGEKMIGGVWRYEDVLKGVPRDPKILAAIKKLHPGDKCRDRVWFEAEVTLRSPAADWRTTEALWRIASDGRFLDEVEGLFLGWAEASEKLVDSAINRLQKSG